MLNRLFATLLCLALPALAAAQSAPTPKVDPGQRVWLTRMDGFTVEGHIARATSTDIELDTTDGRKTYPLASIFRIEKPDPIWDGALIGAATFVAAALIGQTAGFGGGACRFVTASDGTRTCVEAAPGSKTARTTTTAVTMALFAAGGALIDFLKPDHDVVWEQPAKATVSISPTATLHSIGLNGSVRW